MTDFDTAPATPTPEPTSQEGILPTFIDIVWEFVQTILLAVIIFLLIRNVVRAAARGDTDVSLCGEMAGDPMYALVLMGLGIRTLSMVPGAIPEIKKVVRSVTMKQANRVAKRVMSFGSVREVNNYLRDETRKILPDYY